MAVVFKIVGYSALSVIVIFLTVLIYRGISARKMPDLETWHNTPPLEDNLSQGSYNDFSEYLADRESVSRHHTRSCHSKRDVFFQ